MCVPFYSPKIMQVYRFINFIEVLMFFGEMPSWLQSHYLDLPKRVGLAENLYCNVVESSRGLLMKAGSVGRLGQV